MNKSTATNRFGQPITDDVLDRAIERGKQRTNTGMHAVAVQYAPTDNTLQVFFADHSAVVLPVEIYPELVELSAAELKDLALGFGGSALCLDRRDLHVSIAGLVAASRSLMGMATTVVAAHHGSRTSEAKAAASRQNGQKGGRPRKPIFDASF